MTQHMYIFFFWFLMFHVWFCLILLDVKINLYQCRCQCQCQGVTSNVRVFLKAFEQRNKDMYMQHCLSEINSSSRCRLYIELKQVFTPGSYLSVRMDKKFRTSYTKFRLSSHKLLVEGGRWMKPKLQYEMRKCTLCDSEDIEDEYHVTLVCHQFKNLRTKYIKKYYYTRPSMPKFIEIMHLDTKCEQFKLMLFIKYMFKMYAELREQL